MENYWTSRNSRRRFLGAMSVGGLGAVGIAAVGCGSDSNDSSSPKAGASPSAGATQAAQIRKGGNVRFAQTAPISQTLDPHTGLNQALIYWQFVGNIGIRRALDGTLKPELITKWEIPGDGSELVFTVRDDVAFHDKAPINGRKMVADDLAFSLMHIAGKAGPAATGGTFVRASTLPNLSSATAVNDTTVSVKLSKPHSGFLAGVSEWRNNVIPREYIDKGGAWNNPAALVGTGPWIVASYQDNAQTVFKPNPQYWDKGKPHLDTVTQIFYGDVASSQAAFAKGDLDWLQSDSAAINSSIKKIAGDAKEVSWHWTAWHHFRFNIAKKPWDDQRVRRAFFLVLDYKNMGDSYYGPGKWQYTGPLAVGFPEAISSVDIQKVPGYDPATKSAQLQTAKDLLNAAGFPNGKGLDFKIMPYQATGDNYENAVRAQADLVKAFPDIKIALDVPADVATFSRRQASGDFEVVAYRNSSAPDAVLELQQNFSTNGSRNVGKYSDPSMDALLDKAASQLDSAQRADTLKSIQQKGLEALPTIYAYQADVTFFFNKKLEGLEGFTPLGGGVFDPLWLAQNFWWSA